MCGISGLLKLNGEINESDIDAVRRISNAIIHRGPDAEGLYSDQNVVLAHRRLSIIDIAENSNQPMFDNSGRIALIFNGEIYNHADLRKELEQEYEFSTDHSDTETIIYAYKKWGMKCLEKFIGMFAFALYDMDKKVVFLARDRLGKKPIYYRELNGETYFCSESSALFESGRFTKEINDEAIYDYLSYLTTESPNSFFKGVHKIPAGCYIKFESNKQELIEYWNVSDHLNIENNDDDETVYDKTECLLHDSMKHRNVSDVPIAVALSGGLDSSLNLKHSNDISSSKLIAINVSYQETSDFDESQIAKRYSEELGIDYIPVVIDQKDYKKWILDYFKAQKDTPIGDPNSPLLFGISKVAAQHGCKVLQVGEGGDEIGGYPVYDSLKKLNKITAKFPKMLFEASRFLPLPKKIKREIDVLSTGGAVTRRFLFGFTDQEKNKFWKGKPHKSSFCKLERYAEQVRSDLPDSFLRKVLNIEYKVRLAELLLPRVDYPSMAASVEARSPFMDHKLIEYSGSVPFNIKMRNGAKTVIRSFAQKVLPDYIMNQPKVGFGMLLTPFLNKELPDWFETEILKVKDAPIKSYISEEFLENLYKVHMNKRTEGYRMWILFSLNKWITLHK